jgi:hypothetical protein
MRLIIIFISYVSSHPACFRPSPAHHQGCPELLLCYHLVLVMFVGCLCIRGGGLAVLQRHLHGRTDSQQTQQEPNGSVTVAQDTPDDGPVKARNM